MLNLVHSPLSVCDPALPEIPIHVDRVTLARRIWRGVAEDGTEFGFDLEAPLQPGQVVLQSATARYVVVQQPEALVEIALDLPPSAAAGVGWAIGNLHLELSSETDRLLALDEPAVRQLLDRIAVPYRTTRGVFRPGRFARGQLSTHELGRSHQH